MKYLIIIEPTATGFSAYSPDIDGCVATGANREEVEQRMREAIEFHLEGMQAERVCRCPYPRAKAFTSS